MPDPKILVFSGSTRTGSHNARLAALVAKELVLGGAQVTRISLIDFPMPLYDGDLEAASGPPDNAVKLKRMIMLHAGVFIASPEYNASITPLLKNTLDWVSRVREDGEPTYAAFKDRVFAIGGASNGAYGAMRSLMALRQVLELGCGALVLPEQLAVREAATAFDERDRLVDERAAGMLKSLARRLIETARLVG
ncbi:MAG: NAD(P)H-dependent oxidoreductase [Proteobacteria bacterium]|nr:NAD(P)H-dependent oxidoreductase [Pseudomonadota bacterium]